MNKGLNEGWEPLVVSVKDAMLVSNLGKTYLYELIGNGSIASLKRGKRRLILYKSLKQFLAQSTIESEASCSNFA
jgi:excisionase family DNA binding protein